MVKRPRDLAHRVARSLRAVGSVERSVGPDVRIAEKIAGGHRNVTERGDVVNCSKAILRPLGVVRR